MSRAVVGPYSGNLFGANDVDTKILHDLSMPECHPSQGFKYLGSWRALTKL